MITETKRLLLREFHEDDADEIYHMNLDPEVMRYVHDPPFKNVEESREFIKNYDHYKIYGFGRWTVLDKETGEFLGWCGLKKHPEYEECDVGYRFKRKHWGKGYATESAVASLELGFKKFNMPAIIGRALKMNTASVKVLQKLGMQYFKRFDFEGAEGVIYRIDKGTYDRTSIPIS